MTFAELLAQAQQRLGLKTQEALAERIGVHLNTVHLYLAGKSLPPASRVARLANDLQVSLAEISQVLVADRALRRAGILIDTPKQAQTEIDRLKANRAADNLEAMVHVGHDTGPESECVPHVGPRIPHLVTP